MLMVQMGVRRGFARESHLSATAAKVALMTIAVPFQTHHVIISCVPSLPLFVMIINSTINPHNDPRTYFEECRPNPPPKEKVLLKARE
jgi:hypothetical protein